METNGGVKLKQKEIKLINALKRLGKRWQKDGKDLYLYSASGSLHVMMYGDTKRNPAKEYDGEGANRENSITTINIPNDGGDW